MKKFLFTLIFSLSCVISKAQITDNITFSLSDITFDTLRGYTRITMKNCQPTEIIGAPELQKMNVWYVIPYNKHVSQIVINNSMYERLPGLYNIYPKQPDIPSGNDDNLAFVEPDSLIYRSSVPFPNKSIDKIEEYYDNGYKILYFQYNPLRYIPSEQILEVCLSISFELVLTDSEEAGFYSKRKATLFHEMHRSYVTSRVNNPNFIDSYFCNNTRVIERNVQCESPIDILRFNNDVMPEYIIITNNKDINGDLIEIYNEKTMIDVFQEMADWKTQQGIPAILVSIDTINEQYLGSDLQEKIRNFLLDVYFEYGSMYVLLGGDVNIIPERMLNDGYPSDMYYSAVGFNFDTNFNGLFGDNSDSKPYNIPSNFYIARAPVENVKEAEIFLQKTIQYEEMGNMSYSERGYINNLVTMDYHTNSAAIMEKYFGATYDGLLYGIYQNNIKGWRSNNFNDYNVFSHSNDGWQNYFMPLSRANALECFGGIIPKSLDNGTGEHAHIIYHCDHSGYTTLGTNTENNESITREDVDCFTNSPFYNIIFTNGCKPAEFQKDCIVERFLNNPNGGAVAVIASSANSWGGSEYIRFANDTGTNSMLSDLYYLNWGNQIKLPSCYTLGVIHINYRYDGYIYQTKNHLFGDPTLPVWTRIPLDLTVIASLTDTNNSLDKTLTVSVSGMDYAQYATNDVMVCVMKDNEVYMREQYNGTASSHDFVFTVAPETAGNLTVTVTGHNYIPYQTTVPVNITTKNLFVSNHCVIDDTYGNDNGKADAGETFNIGVTLKNSGNANLTNITGTIRYSFADPAMNNLINRIDSTANFGNIQIGDSATANNFKLALSNAVPDGAIMTCTLLLSENSNGGNRPYSATKTFTLRVGASEMEYVSVKQETLQNGNVQLDVDVINQGYGQAKGVTATLASNDVLMVNGTATYGDFDHLEAKSGSFVFTPNGSYEEAQFTLTLTDAYNKTWTYDFNLHTISTTVENLAFTSTEQSIKLTWDPVANSNGYYIYRSLTENGEYERLNNYPVPSSFYTDLGLQVMHTYYYAVSFLDSDGNESPRSTITAWTSLPAAAGWPIEIPDGLGRAWGTSANTADIDGDGKQEIFLATGDGGNGGDIGYVLAFNHLGEELYDIDHNPTITSGFANVGVSMNCTPAIADIDADGIAEIVVATRHDNSYSYPSRKMLVYKSCDADNDGKPDLAWEHKLDNSNINGVVLADLDNNGTMEIIAPTKDGTRTAKPE